MDDLMQFLRDRIDEDESVARAAGGANADGLRWLDHGSGSGLVSDDAGMVVTYDAGVSDQHAAHIAHQDPARALREVEAKRGLLKRYEEPETSAVLPDSSNKLTAGVERTVLLEVFRHLTLPYADHPDYREEWRP
ncbi:DUF6221 family protein [Streptomyces atratus]|uniref:Uncharacterized protein n=1 Tax=Streptomyces atratus TaxID=1893 RepID=A0A1K2EDC3_STRAR|nr:DUF6221 family protein [Streptomyces atratus]SFY32813.1 hypothetical protein SAMN02787144_101861 [Streptomyces atratus]